ncbi:hypothetical protein OKW18_000623 [Streptomyces pratensis]|nr:hypothetical protein [Streptomyces pratensis]
MLWAASGRSLLWPPRLECAQRATHKPRDWGFGKARSAWATVHQKTRHGEWSKDQVTDRNKNHPIGGVHGSSALVRGTFASTNETHPRGGEVTFLEGDRPYRHYMRDGRAIFWWPHDFRTEESAKTHRSSRRFSHAGLLSIHCGRYCNIGCIERKHNSRRPRSQNEIKHREFLGFLRRHHACRQRVRKSRICGNQDDPEGCRGYVASRGRAPPLGISARFQGSIRRPPLFDP